MRLPFFKKSKRLGLRRREKRQNPLLTARNISTTAIFLGFSLLVSMICFLGQTPASFQVLPQQIARFNIVADASFSYPSRVLTEKLKEDRKDEIARVYSINTSAYEKAEKLMATIMEHLNTLDMDYETQSEEERTNAINQLRGELSESYGIPLNLRDTMLILNTTDPNSRQKIFEEASIILNELFNEGIFELQSSRFDEAPAPYIFGIQVDGRQQNSQVHSTEEALRFLKINILALDIERSLGNALYRILRHMIEPNLFYDADKTQERIDTVLESIEPVAVSVDKGDIIIKADNKVSAEQYECLNAYRKFLAENDAYEFESYGTFGERFLISVAIFLCTLIYLKIGMRRFFESKRRLALTAVILLISLLFIRIVLSTGSSSLFAQHTGWLLVLPALLPILLAPIIVTLMVGEVPAAMLAIIQSVFVSLMLGNAIQFMLIAVLAGLATIYACRHIRLRGEIVRAGLLGGMTWGLCLFLVSALHESPWHIALSQFGTSLICGIACGMLTIGMLPFLEGLFKITTNISLLELTDYNHPLLQRLQMTAPGTYHHSLMVAMLSERAAQAIGANSLLCRASSIFHDIGKLVKPEYFVENQGGGANPHDNCSPSMSALVIKSHVKEGVNIAKESKLPQVIIDVIEQHHGTTLIEYFYHKAQQAPNDQLDAESVEESTFRYDGPRPRFKESAIISLADTIEASSRTLPKVTPQSVDELLDKIIEKRLMDHQFDECDLTFAELCAIKKAFAMTLLNTMHSRIAYPSSATETTNRGRDDG